MINQRKIRTLLKKTQNAFISQPIVSEILKIRRKEALDILIYLEEKGYIEKADIDELWMMSIRGKVMVNKKINKEFKIDTLNKHLVGLIERAQIVNSSIEFPYYVTCMKITSEYPFMQVSPGMEIAYALKRKNLTREEYEAISRKLRQQYQGRFSNFIQQLAYPLEAIRILLKSGRHTLKLTRYENNQIEEVDGYKIFENLQEEITDDNL